MFVAFFLLLHKVMSLFFSNYQGDSSKPPVYVGAIVTDPRSSDALHLVRQDACPKAFQAVSLPPQGLVVFVRHEAQSLQAWVLVRLADYILAISIGFCRERRAVCGFVG